MVGFGRWLGNHQFSLSRGGRSRSGTRTIYSPPRSAAYFRDPEVSFSRDFGKSGAALHLGVLPGSDFSGRRIVLIPPPAVKDHLRLFLFAPRLPFRIAFQRF